MAATDKTVVCPSCGRKSKTVARRHMRTAYVNEADNYMESCMRCFLLSEKHWDEMWAEYYRDCL